MVDSSTGQILTAHFFVATLGDSSYPYVEAFPDEKLDKWLLVHVNALRYLGGVLRVIVPDNLLWKAFHNRFYGTNSAQLITQRKQCFMSGFLQMRQSQVI